MSSDAHRKQIEEQVVYWAERAPASMRPVDTPYIERHLGEVLRAADLPSNATVCEWGAGLGRFSRRIADHGFDVTAIELSPELAHACRAVLDGSSGRVAVGDVADVLGAVDTTYDAMLGFFMLHHLPDLLPYFEAGRRRLKPGGRMVFVEPNPFNPLYPVQIAITPGMKWRAERGIYRLWPRAVRRAAVAAGFTRVTVTRYGLLPRAVYNLAARVRSERWPERLIPASTRAFQVIVAET
jgi:2-polyprenyl-3-methyl-5-hydroxy-6-metoxy-1,4-benzoquinol methylase